MTAAFATSLFFLAFQIAMTSRHVSAPGSRRSQTCSLITLSGVVARRCNRQSRFPLDHFNS